MPSFAALSARDDGQLPLAARLVGLLLAVGSLVAAIFGIDNDAVIVVASVLVIAWNIVYLTLLLAGIQVLLPVTITFDLIAWLISLIWGVIYSIWAVPELGRYLSAGMSPCSTRDENCDRLIRIMKARVATSSLLWALT